MTISLFMFLFTAALALDKAPQRKSLEQLKWLAGCWEMRRDDRITEEQWMSPRGGVMIGMSRTVRGDSLIELEQVRIESRGDDLYYVASPLRQAMAEFKGAVTADGGVSFENPQHDFPTKISYRRQGADSLMASIEGQRGGRTRIIEYPYRRAVCPSPST
jgi:hypothetical protein